MIEFCCRDSTAHSCGDIPLKIIIAAVSFFALVGFTAATFPTAADAQSYNSQRARQDREYKSLSNATQRAYAPARSNSSSGRR